MTPQSFGAKPFRDRAFFPTSDRLTDVFNRGRFTVGTFRLAFIDRRVVGNGRWSRTGKEETVGLVSLFMPQLCAQAIAIQVQRTT